jgi:hypothetical protein
MARFALVIGGAAGIFRAPDRQAGCHRGRTGAGLRIAGTTALAPRGAVGQPRIADESFSVMP